MIDGMRVKLRRVKLGLSQKELGEHIGQDQAYISRLERGQLPGATIAVLERLADVLGVSTDYLLNRIDEPDPELQCEPAALATVGD